MALFSRETPKSPAFVFVAYIVLALLATLGFRALFPGESPPLPIFDRGWRSALWFIEIVALFPALALSALVIPFCMGNYHAEDDYTKLSPDIFKTRFKVPVITAISAAGAYALLFFLILPLAQNSERNMRFEAEIYRMAMERARAHVEAAEWVKASQFLGIANSVWRDADEIIPLRNETEIQLERTRLARLDAPETPAVTVAGIPGLWDPLNTAEAMAMSRAAYDEGRFFDAHWLATLGRRLAGENSPEGIAAAQLAARSWNLIEAQRPSDAQLRAHDLFRLKMAGYNAALSGDWVRSFYIFSELYGLTPMDPDVRNFLALSTRQLEGITFFTDEMNVTVGNTVTGPIFSLPAERGAWRGRSVLRLASLSHTPDVAFGVGLEYMLFDHQSRLMLHLHAPYAKFTPFRREDTPDVRQNVLVLMRALNRYDPEGVWEPTVEWSAGETFYHPAGAQLLLNIDYETFLMLSHMRQDVSAMHMGDLFAATAVSGETGHIPQVFRAEILNRLGSGLFLLPMAIAAIAAGWYLRTKRFPRYLFIPLLFVFPVVFNGLAYVFRFALNVIGISLTMALSFPLAFFLFSLIMALAFAGSLFLLAMQKGG